jgi:hypothetical protein
MQVVVIKLQNISDLKSSGMMIMDIFVRLPVYAPARHDHLNVEVLIFIFQFCFSDRAESVLLKALLCWVCQLSLKKSNNASEQSPREVRPKDANLGHIHEVCNQ